MEDVCNLLNVKFMFPGIFVSVCHLIAKSREYFEYLWQLIIKFPYSYHKSSEYSIHVIYSDFFFRNIFSNS